MVHGTPISSSNKLSQEDKQDLVCKNELEIMSFSIVYTVDVRLVSHVFVKVQYVLRARVVTLK